MRRARFTRSCPRVESEKLIGYWIRERIQQDTVHDRKDGGVDANTQGERHDGGGP
jgi:hypothetical protein